MVIKNAQYKVQGMNKDLSYSAFDPKYSWHNKNIRLTARDNNDLLSITNEKGTLELIDVNDLPINGEALGSCVLNDNLILFTHSANTTIDESMSGLKVDVKSITKVRDEIVYDTDTTTADILNIDRSCTEGYTLVNDGGVYSCQKETTTIDEEPAVIVGGSTNTVEHFTYFTYGQWGTAFYKYGNFNLDGTWSTSDPLLKPNVYTNQVYTAFPNANVITYNSGPWINHLNNTTDGRLNKCGVWLSGNQGYEGTLGFSRSITVTESKNYYIGVGSDNYGYIKIDGVEILHQVDDLSGWSYPFRVWNVYPVYLAAGTHLVSLSVYNYGVVGILGFEIYNATEEQLIAAVDDAAIEPYILFSTKNIANGELFDIGNYTCTDSTYQLINEGGVYSCQKIITTTDTQPAIEDIAYTCNNPDYTLINDNGVYSCTKVTQIVTPIYESSLEFSSNLSNIIEPIKLSFDYLNNSNNTLSSSGFFTSSTNKLVFNIESKLSGALYSISNIKLNRASVDITPVSLTSFNWDAAGDSSWLVPSSTIIYQTSTTGNYDNIYKLNNFSSTNSITTELLYSGNLNFNINNKIQTLPFYENESIQKVYWIDGRNQPRVINIADGTVYGYGNTQFDFIQELLLQESVVVTKQYGGGSFKAGVIQYAFTYFNKNGAESNIFYITPINSISPIDRGGKVDEFIQNTFKLELNNLESKYQYVRIYSIYRTSKDATPEVKSVVDLSIDSTGYVSYIDAGTSGSIVSSDLLLYVGGEELIPQCMSQKNNTLFLGNIELASSEVIPSTLKDVDENADTLFSWIESQPTTLESTLNGSNNAYPYKPDSLRYNTNVAHFKYDETYRLGVQGQYKNGKWSSPIWIGADKKVDKRYQTFYDGISSSVLLIYINGQYTPSQTIIDWFLEKGFIKVRPVIVPLNYSDRTIVAQGIVNNTLGILKNRLQANSGSNVFAFPDYLFRTNSKAPQSTGKTYDGRYAHMDILKINNEVHPYNSSTPSKYIENMGSWNEGGDDFHDVYDSYGHAKPLNDDYDREFMFVDRNMVNFWSPEIEYNSELISQYQGSITSASLYGFAFETGYNYSFSLDSGKIDDFVNSSSLNFNKNNYYTGNDSSDSIIDKNIRTRVNSGGNNNNQILFPIWSPKDYNTSSNFNNISNYNIPFTKSNKSGMFYFGINSNLIGSKITYDINTPYVINNDSSIFYKTNVADNQSNNGNILYSKLFNKTYAGGSYKNQMRDEASGDKRAVSITSPLNIKYNSSNHALFSFKEKSGTFKCMPRLQNVSESTTLDSYANVPSKWYRMGANGYSADVLSRNLLAYPMLSTNDSTKNSLPIFDLYVNDTDKDSTRYGGTSLDALYNNTWIPCGAPVAVSDGMILNYTDGDTYIQRFDVLRVFPNDLNQIPQHTEIISFLCESFINLDGRSDVNRYNTDSSLMTKSNYGLLNNIYSQKNNYFNYNILDPLLFKSKSFSNTIVWTKTKVSGATTDNWTSISMLSSIDLDGVYGGVSSINLFNNDLYAFQSKGIARLLFNERVQQQASDGISVELTNGYKVPEYRYISNQYGCGDKWSIIEGKLGIYFIDYINKSIISIGDGIKDLGLSLGFKSWFNNVKDADKYILSYDRNNNDLYIHNGVNCLNYSEILNTFVSFYDYTGILQMKNVWDKFISIKSSNDITNVWLNNSGNYNMFYGEQKPFSIEYLINPDPLNDKVFNTFEYRLNDQFIDWNHLEVSNWYQYGELNDRQYSDSLKRKFNVNRVQLPRQSKTLDSNSKLIDLDTRNSLNRIRSTWTKLKLEHKVEDVNNNRKFDMQDLNITYTI